MSWVPSKSNSNLWRPHAGQQTAFLSSPAWEALYGGSAGPGKTDCLVMEALRQVHNPAYNAVLFRRVFPSLETADGMIARSQRWYPALGGRYNWAKHYWTFPSGAHIYFGHMQHETSKFLYQGSQFSFIGFDELTEFTETQYTYMFTRLRAAGEHGLRTYVRACTNPGNVGHLWVKNRFITRDIRNKLRWFALVDGVDTEVDPSFPHARSRAFYPAKLADNPSLGEEYLGSLLADPDAVQRARLIEGDWDAEYKSGLVYPEFSSSENVVDVQYDPSKPIFWACDDGYAHGGGPGTIGYHPRVVLVCQMNELGGVNVLDEYVETGVSDYHQTIQEVQDMGVKDATGRVILPYGKPEVCYVDSSAAMFAGTLWRLGWDVVRSTHAVHEGIRNVRRLIRDQSGVRLLRVSPRCQYTIFEFGRYSFSDTAHGKNGEPIPTKMDDHAMDSIRYAVWNLRILS